SVSGRFRAALSAKLRAHPELRTTSRAYIAWRLGLAAMGAELRIARRRAGIAAECTLRRGPRRVAHSSFFCLSGAFCWCRRNTPSKQTMPGRGATLKSYCGTSASHLPRPQPRPSHQLATQKTNNSDQSRREQDHATGFGNRSNRSVEVGSVEQEITVIINTEGDDIASIQH